jgi:hypothetical protein
MPPITHIALRYLLWMVGLSLVNMVAIALLGLPASQTVNIMLASVPALIVAQFMVRYASRDPVLSDWVSVWGVILAIYLVVNVGIFVALSPTVRAALADPAGLRQMATVAAAVAAMQALFLFIGQLMARREG